MEAKASRPLSLTEKASMGDKTARHILSGMGIDCDYDESDMCDYPRGYVMK